VVYLGPTEAGKSTTRKKHDKKAADEVQIVYPAYATLDQDTGFQGYAPEGVLTQQPKKEQKQAVKRERVVAQWDHFRGAYRRGTRHRGHQTLPNCQGCSAVDEGKHFGSGDGDCLRPAQSACALSASVSSLRCAPLYLRLLKPIMSNELRRSRAARYRKEQNITLPTRITPIAGCGATHIHSPDPVPAHNGGLLLRYRADRPC
jgi:hypothetical protein